MPRLRDVTRVDVKWHTGGGYTGAPVTDPEEAERVREWMEGGPDAEIARLQAENVEAQKRLDIKTNKIAEYRAETARMAIEKYPEKEASILARMFPKEKPPEQFLSPFEPEFKAQFEQKLFGYLEKQYNIPGGNPHKMNIPDMVERISTQRLPQLWESVTNNQVRWEDRDTIKENFPKIWKYWIQTITKDRSRINADLKTKQAGAIKDYEYEMGKLDTRIKTARTNLEEKRKERLERLEPPKQRTIWNPTTKQMEIQEWDPALQQFADTGKIAKPPKEEKKEKPKEDELKKAQMLDDWRADYKTRLSQLEKRYGQFNATTGMWMPNPETIEEYKKEAAKLEKEYEEGTSDILKGKVPKRMTGALVSAKRKEDYVSGLIQNLTKSY